MFVLLVLLLFRERSDRKRNERTFASKKSWIKACISLSLSLSLKSSSSSRLSFSQIVVRCFWRRPMTTTRAQQLGVEFIKTTLSKKYEKKTNEMWSPLKSLALNPRSLPCTLSNAFWGPGNRRESGGGVEIVVVWWVSREDDRRRTYYMLLCVCELKRRRRRKSDEKKEKERDGMIWIDHFFFLFFCDTWL